MNWLRILHYLSLVIGIVFIVEKRLNILFILLWIIVWAYVGTHIQNKTQKTVGTSVLEDEA